MKKSLMEKNLMKKSAVKKTLSLVCIAAFMAIAFAGCTPAPAAPVPVVDEVTGAVTAAIPTVTVRGDSEIKLTPDMVNIQFGVNVREKATAAEAMQEATQAMDAVKDKLLGLGVKEEDLQTANFSLYEQYRYDSNGNITGKPFYNVSNALYVTYYDIDNAGTLIDAAIEAGATNTNSLTFGLKDPKAREEEALTQALENARTRAEALAKASGKRVGEVLVVNDGTQISEPLYTNAPQAAYESASRAPAADMIYGGAQVSAGTITLTATVTVRFTMQ